MSIRFNGTNNWLQLAIGVGTPVAAGSYCGWFKVVTDRNTFSEVLYETSFGSDHELFIGSESDGTQMDSSDSAANGGAGATLTGFNAVVGTWYWGMAVWNGTSYIYYFGSEAGTLSNAQITTGLPPYAGNLTSIYIGNDPYSEFFNGEVAYVRRWTVKLTPAEVDAEYRSATPVKTASLFGDWRLASTATATADSSGNSRTLTTHGTLANGTTNPTPPAAGGTTYPVSIAGSLTSAGALLKQDNKILAGALTSSGLLQKRAAKIYAGTLGSSSLLQDQGRKFLAGVLTASGALTDKPIKVMAGALSSAGSLREQMSKALAGALTSSGLLREQVNKIIAGSLTSAGALTNIKTALLVLVGTLTSSGLLSKRTNKIASGVLTSAGTILKRANKILGGALTSSGAPAFIKVASLVLSGVLGASGAISKRVNKVYAGTLTPTGSLLKSIRKFFGSILSSAGAFVGSTVGPNPDTAAVINVEADERFPISFEDEHYPVVFIASDYAITYIEDDLRVSFLQDSSPIVYAED